MAVLIETIFRECFRSFAALPGASLIDDGEVFGTRTDVPVLFFNGIAITRLGADPDAAIQRTIALFDGHPFRWWLLPSNEPADLETRLQTHGFKHVYDAGEMWLGIDTFVEAPIPSGLRIEPATDAAQLDSWAAIIMSAFERPAGEAAIWAGAYERMGFDGPWFHFVAYEGRVPVATTSVLLAGELAGIYHVATMSTARGRGIGAAITRAALRFAFDRGAREAVLQSSEMGEGVYRSIGFMRRAPLRLYAKM
ncbi:MAG: GNAT family N-acetyltransferase [Thermoanaerobaculia bacterium]|nr:GNAT family N-acetyltransferase [Thermoanaerobaculia bacterium]